MSIMRYISFPRELTKYQVSYIKFWGEDEFRVNKNTEAKWERIMPIIEDQVDGRFSIWDFTNNALFNKAVFNNCFINPFIYEFYAEVPDYYYEQKSAISQKYRAQEAIDGCLDFEAMDLELSEYWNKEWSLQNQVLYKYLHDNLNAGEFIEIYESWIEEEDERGMIFGPPTSEIVISLEELLSLPFLEGPDDLGERIRLTIHKT